MDPTQIIEELCRRHRVPRSFGERLRPLIVRAATREPDARQRIMDMIERSFIQEAERERMRATQRTRRKVSKRREPNEARKASGTVEERMLGTVAAILHGWDPPEWIERFGRGERDHPADDSDAD